MAEAEKDMPSVEQQDNTEPAPVIADKVTVQEAAEHTAFDHSLTVRQAIKYYKWAIFWCLAVR
jgi:hypothetical protein